MFQVPYFNLSYPEKKNIFKHNMEQSFKK
jgi:hypothetical protein